MRWATHVGFPPPEENFQAARGGFKQAARESSEFRFGEDNMARIHGGRVWEGRSHREEAPESSLVFS